MGSFIDQCDITLKEIREKLENEFPNQKIPSITTISRYLDGQFFTVKNIKLEPESRNSEKVKLERKEYAHWFHDNCGKYLIFIHEFNFHACTRRTRGRSKIGQPAVKKVMDSKIATLNV